MYQSSVELQQRRETKFLDLLSNTHCVIPLSKQCGDCIFSCDHFVAPIARLLGGLASLTRNVRETPSVTGTLAVTTLCAGIDCQLGSAVSE